MNIDVKRQLIQIIKKNSEILKMLLRF